MIGRGKIWSVTQQIGIPLITLQGVSIRTTTYKQLCKMPSWTPAYLG